MFAAVAVFFTACTEECNHEFIEVDYSKDLVGTWTCLTDDFAEALVISADGSVVSTRLFSNEYREDIKGKIVLENGNVTMTFEDGGNFKSHFDIIPGMAFSIFNEEGERLTFNYCKEDLADEIVGMWVCTEEVFGQEEESVGINTFTENGKSYLTAFIPDVDGYTTQLESDYKVVGNLLIGWMKGGPDASVLYQAFGLNIIPNGTELGDIMTVYNPVFGTKPTFLRVKQTLELPGNKYDYIKTFVTNVKGEDKDIPFLNTSFNFAKMDGSIIDKFLKSILFTVEFPDANTIKYSYLLEGQNIVIEAPIAVEANKMTIKMSENEKAPFYKDIDVYTFQDQDNTQMHMYMHTTSFEKFFANTAVAVMLGNGQLDATDAEAIEGVYKTIADAVESINLSLVMSKTK